MANPDRLAKGLGWYSIAAGAVGLIAPKALGRAMGMDGQERLIQAYGMRELAAGIGILSSDDPRPWLWARVGGDLMDAATLVPRLRADNPRRVNAAAALAGAGAIATLDIYCATRNRESAPAVINDYSDRSGFPDTPEKMRGAAKPTD